LKRVVDQLEQMAGHVIGGFVTPLKMWLADLDGASVLFAVILVGAAYVFRKPLTRGCTRLLVATGQAIGLEIPDHVQKAVKPAIQALILSLFGMMAVETLKLPPLLSGTVQKLLISIAVAAIFVALLRTTEILERLLEKHRSPSTAMQIDWLVRLSRAAVGIIGVSAVLKIWSIDLGPVLTGVGVLGAAVALAAQDLFKNLLAGFTNLSEHRYQVGDWIKVDGLIEGVVEKMEFRSTLVRRFDQAPVHVPNAELSNGVLTNFSRMPHRRIYWNVGVQHHTTTEQLQQICGELKAFLAESDDFDGAGGIPMQVRIDELGPSSIQLLIYCFTKSAVYDDYLTAKEKLVIAIRSAVENAGTSLAYPSQSVYVEKLQTQENLTADAT